MKHSDYPESQSHLLRFQSKFVKFDSLMQFRVKHLLLVSSSYDSFVLEEDGQLTDLIYNEFLELNLTIAPHVRKVSTAAQALEVVASDSVDLVLIFKRVSDIDVVEFGRQVKTLQPDLPVILLAYHERELEAMLAEDGHAAAIDYVFVWAGDVSILLAIVKLVEDLKNVDRDTREVGVRTIIIVEDSAKFYSTYLPLLYREILQQTLALMADGLNISHKFLRMRARPKILLARSYDEAWRLFERFRKYMLAIISDFRFEVNGEVADDAGIRLIERIRREVPDLPVLMQSSTEDNATVAAEHRVGFLYKRSPALINDLRNFILAQFGFGDFVFSDPDTGRELARATDFRSMEHILEWIDEKSLLYHANRNHFSNWLLARTEFDLAERLRPRRVSEFKDAHSLRVYLIRTFKAFRHEKQRGVIADYNRHQFDVQSDFVRVGGGSLGGKGRGLAFVNALLNQYKLYQLFDGVELSVPKTVIIGTDLFDRFVRENGLLDIPGAQLPDEVVAERFLAGRMPESLVHDLDSLLDVMEYPLAVRSSSTLEDSQLQPFAGIYDTHMLPNNHLTKKRRLEQLVRAIKLIYASVFYGEAQAYHEASGNRLDEEKMAVIIQQAVGSRHGDLFYPTFSGVGLSYNYYPLEDIAPEDGAVYVALGFGKTIVEGMNCLRFSPSYPDRLPQFSTIKDLRNNSQHYFFAIDLSRSDDEPVPGGAEGLSRHAIGQAESDGTLQHLCSTYSHENDRVYIGCSHEGIRVITFAPILKMNSFPLCDIVRFLLQLGAQGLNCPIEIEFAVNLDTPPGEPKQFYFLQIRPMMRESHIETVDLAAADADHVVARSFRTLGNMHAGHISDIVFVDPETFDRGETVAIAAEVGRFNKLLEKERLPYLLIGPGRWGTSERWLGIPVAWHQISGAKVIVEAAYGDFAPDPSFGTHFFQNLTSFQMGYLTVNELTGNGSLSFEWLRSLEIVARSNCVIHARSKQPIEVLIDGRIGQGVIVG